MSSVVGYCLPVPWHRSVQLSYLDGQLYDVWFGLAVVSKKDQFLSMARLSALVLSLVTISIIFSSFSLPSSSMLYVLCWRVYGRHSQIRRMVISLNHSLHSEVDLSPSPRMDLMVFLKPRYHVAALLGSILMDLSERVWVAFMILR